MSAKQRIETERRRQIEEGWTPGHDDCLTDGSLLRAATLYYLRAIGAHLSFEANGAPTGWPWARKWWKPTLPARDLEKAGALCLAERDRIRRATPEAYVGHVDSKLGLISRRLDELLNEASHR